MAAVAGADQLPRTAATIEAWTAMDGTQGGDPAKLADALVQLAALDEPPLRFAGGADAVDAFEQTAAAMLASAGNVLDGKIHHYGLSNFTGWQLQLAVSAAKAMGIRLPASIQSQYSLASRELEFEVIPAAIHNDVGILPPRSPWPGPPRLPLPGLTSSCWRTGAGGCAMPGAAAGRLARSAPVIWVTDGTDRTR